MNLLLVAIAIVALYFFSTQKYMRQPNGVVAENVYRKWSAIAKPIAESWNINPAIVLAMIAVESEGDEKSVGTAGERGLMQLKQEALTDANLQAGTTYTFDELFDPAININQGCAYLTWNKVRLNNDIGLAIQAYNAGIGTVLKDSSAGSTYRNLVVQYQNMFVSLINSGRIA